MYKYRIVVDIYVELFSILSYTKVDVLAGQQDNSIKLISIT